MSNHYDVLGVAPTASSSEIRSAYRELAKRHHPDVDPGEEASLRMAQINDAYAVLSDAARRAQYDARLELERTRALAAASTSLTIEPAGTGSWPAWDSRWSGDTDPGRPLSQESRTVTGRLKRFLRQRPARVLAVLVPLLTAVGSAAVWAMSVLESEEVPASALEASDVEAQLTAPPLPSDADDPCERPLHCPSGAVRRISLEGESCVQTCTDLRGSVVARSLTTRRGAPGAGQPAAMGPPERGSYQALAEASPPARHFWGKRLVCSYRRDEPPACEFDGAALTLGELGHAAESGWRVTTADGPAPAGMGANCSLTIEPLHRHDLTVSNAANPAGPPYNCRVALRCGRLVYGGGESGYCLCDGAEEKVRGAIDFRGAETDGDPVLALDVAKGKLLVADDDWRLVLTPAPEGRRGRAHAEAEAPTQESRGAKRESKRRAAWEARRRQAAEAAESSSP